MILNIDTFYTNKKAYIPKLYEGVWLRCLYVCICVLSQEDYNIW